MFRQVFQEKLNEIKNEVIKMFEIVKESLSRLEQMIFAQANIDEDIEYLRANEKNINLCELLIENKCILLLATEQPVAHDLRLAISSLKMTKDLERCGDYVLHIAEAFLILKTENKFELILETIILNIKKIIKQIQSMLAETITAYKLEDSCLCIDLVKKDDIIDYLYHQLINEGMLEMKDKPNFVREYNLILFNAKAFERLADHLTNICEEIFFMKNGERMKSSSDFNTSCLMGD